MALNVLQLKRGHLSTLMSLGLVDGEPAIADDDPSNLLLLVGNASGVPIQIGSVSTVLPPQTGQTGKYLGTDGSTASWDEIIIPPALPIQSGQSGKYLSTDGTNPYWLSIPTWMANPMSTAGDIIIGGTAGAAGRLGIGTAGQVLTVIDGNTLGWTTQIPNMSGMNGRVLSTNGTSATWTQFTGLPSFSGLDSGKMLTNNGTVASWVTVSLPPTISGQAGKYLYTDGSSMTWGSISQIPSLSGQGGKILSNDGASYYWTATSLVYPTQTGNAGKFLYTSGSAVSWQDPPTGFANPMTTIGDLIVAGASGVAGRLAHGTTGQVLSSTDSVGGIGWISLTAYLTNPMTTQGDTIYGGTAGAPTRLGIGASGATMLSNGSAPYWLAVGANQTVLTSNGSTPYWLAMTIVPSVTGHAGSWLYTDGSSAYWSTFTLIPSQATHNGQYLTTDGSNVSWATIPAGFANPMTAAGDLIAGTTGGAAGRLSIGSNGQVLSVVSGAIAWAANVTGLPAQAGNNGNFLTTNATTASWAHIYQVPTVVGQNGLFLGNDGSNYSWMALPNQLPTVTGQAGKYLSNDGSNASWVPYSGLPSLSGNSGKILTTDGVTSFWVNPSSAGTNILSRVPITVTSSSLAVLASEIKTVDTTCKTFQIQQITSDTPCRLRVYGSYAAASADFYRSASLDPTGNHGMYAEIILTQANPSWILSPIPTCANEDTVTSTNTYITIQNNGSSTTAITLNFVLLKME